MGQAVPGPVPGWAGGRSGEDAGVPGGDLWQGGAGIPGSCPMRGEERVVLPAREKKQSWGTGLGWGRGPGLLGHLPGGGKMSGLVSSIFAESL